MSDKKPAMITQLVDDWKLRSAQAKTKLRLKYLPVGFDFGRVHEYDRYLSMPVDDQKAFVSSMSNEEFQFWVALETSRVLYVDPVDRNPGSITEAKVARYPNRYDWKP